jgi:cytochrome c-type biogenesis protein CcmE
VRFRVTDGRSTVTVDHAGDPPDLFKDGAPVVCEGAWASSRRDAPFESDRILIRHGAEYKPPKVDSSPQEALSR